MKTAEPKNNVVAANGAGAAIARRNGKQNTATVDQVRSTQDAHGRYESQPPAGNSRPR